MNYFLAILAGGVQGLSEFLPISSTGHLIIFERLFNLPVDSFGLSFDASLHLGTLLAILIFFYKDYQKALRSKKIIISLVIGTVPAVVFGLLLEKTIETQFRQFWVVGASLILFSFVLMYAEKVGKKSKDIGKTSFKDSLIVGLFQSLALIPGISRSGSTISAGLFLNYKREDAARFAFMLSGPIIAGAGAKKLFGILTSSQTSTSELIYFFLGILSSAIFGYLTIKYFLKYLTTKSLKPFIIYRVVLGLILLSTLFWR